MTSINRLSGSGPEPFEACADGGRCWHACPLQPATAEHPEGEGLPCLRVLTMSPLSGYGAGWTKAERDRHARAEAEQRQPLRETKPPTLPLVGGKHDGVRVGVDLPPLILVGPTQARYVLVMDPDTTERLCYVPEGPQGATEPTERTEQ